MGSSAMSSSGGGSSSQGGADAGAVDSLVDAGVTVPNQGWIGGPCASNTDCPFAGGYCITDAEGFPGGTCVQDCARLCPDQDGPNSVTFCVNPPSGITTPEGICIARCDYGLYPGTGCRVGYGCRELPRYSEPTTRRFACLPGDPPTQSTCLQELVAAGVPFEPTVYSDTSPSGQPQLTCHIEDPVRVNGPLRGIPFRYTSSATAAPMLMGCALALSLDRLATELVSHNVTEVEHLGVFNCRVISGTSTLSEHGRGTAIDLAAFRFSDGRRWTVNDDFQTGTMPTTAAGTWMWALVNTMFDERMFNIILTPNYNAAHRNHFHVDLTSGAHYLGILRSLGVRIRDQDDVPLRYIGPNLHGD